MAQIIHDVDLPNTGDGDPLRTAFIHQNDMNTELYETKVDKITGQGLSENNFTDDLKDKLDGIEEFAEVNVQSDWLQADDTADDYIKNKPESFISYPYKGNFPHVDSNVFTMPDGVSVLDVRPCGAGSFIGWNQVGTTLTFSDYTLVEGDYLIVIGIFNDANIFSPLGGVSSVTDDGNGVVVVDIADPLNPIITFDGIIGDGVTIFGSGTALDPLYSVGGGASTFLDLTDVIPSTYTGQAGKYPKVNSGETGLEFSELSIGKVEVYSANKTLTPTDNNDTIFMDSGTLTINPSTQTYQDGYSVAGSASGVANTPIVLTATADWTYIINGATAITSGSVFGEKGGTFTIIRKANLKIFQLNGSII